VQWVNVAELSESHVTSCVPPELATYRAIGMLNPDVELTQISPAEPIGNEDEQEPVIELMVVDGSVLLAAVIPS
jgi:hypothetical protein